MDNCQKNVFNLKNFPGNVIKNVNIAKDKR